MFYNNSLFDITSSPKFTEIWDNVDSFKDDFNDSGIPNEFKDEQNLETIFYLLYAQYGYSTIASMNREQFKYKVFSILFQYGPTWEKKLEIQRTLRDMSIDDISIGSMQIALHGYNQSTAIPESQEDIIPTIDDQNKVKYKKAKSEAIATMIDLLNSDITKEFLNKFKVLFRVIVAPEIPLYYETIVEEEEQDD